MSNMPRQITITLSDEDLPYVELAARLAQVSLEEYVERSATAAATLHIAQLAEPEPEVS